MVTPPNHFDKLEVGILLHDSQTGNILYANTFAEEIYGYSKEELTSMDVADFSSASFSRAEATQRIQAAAEGHSQQFEWRNKRSTGELYWVEVRLSDLTIDETTYVVALVRDITEYKMSLRHLRVLTRITRHNLRNKLNIIDGYLNQIDHEEANSSVIKRIKRNVSELLDLTGWIDSIKSVNRAETQNKACDISQLVAEIGEPYQKEYPEITWKLDCQHAYATVDSTLRTAVDELIDNAVKHNPHENLEISVSVREHPDDKQISICVTDTGRPIPEIEIEPLVSGYDPDPLEHGEGIGLWEVQTIINAHRGRLSINENSTDQKTIEITLPQTDST